MRLGPVTIALTLAALMAKPAAAACDSPLPGPGAPLAVSAPATAADRQALSAAVFLSLSDDGGRTDWPWREMEGAPPCPVSAFRVDGVAWQVSGGEGAAPLRWARAQGSDVHYWLVRGPTPAEARPWAATRRNGSATGASATYLVGSDGGLQFVMRIYEGAPDARRFADDVTAAITGKLLPIAAYDPIGNAVSLSLAVPDGVTGELFRTALIGPQRHATLLGPDGHYFTPIENGVRLRGSDLICGDAYGPFKQTRLVVLAPDDAALDLGCSLYSREGWISIFSTRRPDTSADRANFHEVIRAAQADAGVRGRPVIGRWSKKNAIRASAAWIDKDERGQGIWFIRRGEYVVEIRATFDQDETDAVYDLVAAVLQNTPPPPSRSDRRG